MKKCKSKKAQSAMEYLMTYGWAILIVIIVAAALYALGVFNPATFTGRTATGFQTIGAPIDWDLDSSGQLTLVLANNKMATTLNIHSINASTGNYQGTNITEISLAPGASGYQVIVPISGYTPAQGSTYSVKVTITYDTGGLNHTDTGTLTGVVR